MSFTLYDIVIFHKGCPDGNAAAWVYWYKLTNRDNHIYFTDEYEVINQYEGIYKSRGIHTHIKFIPMEAGKYPTDLDVKGKKILMVDVCPKREEIDKIATEVKSLTILDHHKSGERDVENLKYDNVYVVFDMNRSGCQIAWDYINFFSSRPWFVDVIADRDLWNWELPNSKELGNYLFNHGYYHDWNKMTTLLDFTDTQKEMAIEVGKSLLIVENNRIDLAVKQAIKTTVSIDGVDYQVYLTGCSSDITSEVGNRLYKLEDCDFACMYRYNLENDEWFISCRANNKVDLSIITRKLNGGGHPNAAGFSLKNDKGILQSFFRKV